MARTYHYGKNVFVTGASSGIGQACARMFAENGFNVTGVSRNTKDDYGSVFRKSVAKMAGDEQNGRSPESVAKVALALAGRRNPPARVPVGAEYKALMMLLRVMPDRVRELILSKMYLPED